jgi:glycolate oxidase
MGGLQRELDPGSLLLQQAVKQALDPLGIFNPGKVLPPATPVR